jgi:hypothetical protein
MRMKSLPALIATLVFLAFSGLSAGMNIDKVTETIQNESGRAIAVTISLRDHGDGSYTVVSIEPERKAKEFFDRACEEEYGPSAKWIDVTKNEVQISGSAGYTYSCHSEEDH